MPAGLRKALPPARSSRPSQCQGAEPGRIHTQPSRPPCRAASWPRPCPMMTRSRSRTSGLPLRSPRPCAPAGATAAATCSTQEGCPLRFPLLFSGGSGLALPLFRAGELLAAPDGAGPFIVQYDRRASSAPGTQSGLTIHAGLVFWDDLKRIVKSVCFHGRASRCMNFVLGGLVFQSQSQGCVKHLHGLHNDSTYGFLSLCRGG